MKFGVSWVWVRDVGRDGRSRGRQRRKGHSKARIAFRKRSSYSYFCTSAISCRLKPMCAG